MRFFFDTEFIEDGRTIDLVSIGVVSEDGREYYAQHIEFTPSKASQWVKDNVLSLLRRCNRAWDLQTEILAHKGTGKCSPSCPWRSRAEIGRELVAFCGRSPEFWADHAAYDWVALCRVFGTMMDLPTNWPMFCRDVQQTRDELVRRLGVAGVVAWPSRHYSPEHHALQDAKDCRERFEFIEAERERRQEVGVR